MIYFFTPSFPNNLGKAYNNYMNLLPNDDDWACLMDKDTLLFSDIYNQLNQIINENSDAGMFTCVTNRVGTLKQCYKGIISEETNILEHKKISEELKTNHAYDVEEIDHVVSGHMMVVQKKTWKSVGGFKDGILGVDNDFCEKIFKIGKKVLLMNGIYLFHYYRLHKEVSNTEHLNINK